MHTMSRTKHPIAEQRFVYSGRVLTRFLHALVKRRRVYASPVQCFETLGRVPWQVHPSATWHECVTDERRGRCGCDVCQTVIGNVVRSWTGRGVAWD